MTGEYFCQQCIKVQPLSKELDYFTCMGVPRRLTINPEHLEAKYYELSRSFHPDFFQNTTDMEKGISLGNSALLNTAYRTLKDPIRRAEYLVQLEAGAVKDIRNSPPADLFEEILSLQEDLEAYRSLPPDGASPAQEALRGKITTDRTMLEQRQRDMEDELVRLFSTWDALQSQPPEPLVQEKRTQVLKSMREILSNRTYLKNIVQDLTDPVE